MFVKCGSEYINLDNVVRVVTDAATEAAGRHIYVHTERGGFYLTDEEAAPLLELLEAECHASAGFISATKAPFDRQLRPLPLDVLLTDPHHGYPRVPSAA